jgi:hypothetical protein
MVSAITVTGTWTRPDGSQPPASGGVTFQLAHPITDPDGNVIVAAQTVSADLDANGSISVDLAATDEPGTSPKGNTYYVIESIEGQPRRTYSIIVPYDATNSRVDLADVAPAFDSAVVSRAPSPHAAFGDHHFNTAHTIDGAQHTNPDTYRRDNTPVVLGAGDMDVVEGSPSIRTIHNRWIAWGLPDKGVQRIAGIVTVPPQWDALDIDLWYTTLTGNSGTTKVRDRRLAPNEGDDLFESDTTDIDLSVSVAAEHLAIHTLTDNAPVSDTDSSPIGPGPMLLSFQRQSSGNTLSGDLLVIALVLHKAG